MMTRLVALTLLIAAPAAADDRPPNVVLIYADDLGYGDLSCFGGPTGATPNLDRLAAEGVRLTDFYVAQAVCSASRTALLTGCYPNRLGILGALNPSSDTGIHDDETTLAEVLRRRGYATAIVGKWHLGHHSQFLPTRHGFDQYFGIPYSNDMTPRLPNHADWPEPPLIDGERVVESGPPMAGLTARYTERALAFLDASRGRPFFLYMPHTMPHVPLGVAPSAAGASGRGLYGDVVREIDDSVGAILTKLDAIGAADDTLVIFASDNGPWLNYGDHAGLSGGLREGKGTTFEGGVRVPFVARWPGHIPAGTTCREPAMTIDVLPTIAAIAGAGPVGTADRPIDGLDVTPMLTDPEHARSPHEALFFYWDRGLQAMRSGRWKLHFPHPYRSLAEAGSGGRAGKYREATIDLALFDLEADRAESRDLAAEDPEVVARLSALADRMRGELGDSLTKVAPRAARAPGRAAPPGR